MDNESDEPLILGDNLMKRKTARFVTFALLLGTVTILIESFTVALDVQVDGQPVGQVASKESYQEVVGTVQEDVSDILGYDYDLDSRVSYQLSLVSRSAAEESRAEVADGIYGAIGEIDRQYVIYVDGQEVGSVASLDELEGAMDAQLTSVATDSAVSASYTEDIAYEYRYTSTDVELDPEQLAEVLQEVSVEVVEAVIHTETIPYEIEYVEDDTLYDGEMAIRQPGSDGISIVTERVSYLDGQEQSREVTDTKVVTEPVTQVMRVGTAPEGTPIVTGSFIWPVDGTVTSGLGSRNIGIGSTDHKGIDVACPADEPIYAADGGTVIYAGAMSGYGNIVQIDHSGGCVTYYGHCNSIEVIVGDVIKQGDLIALAGMTGTATGNHLHFEIRYDDVPVNPIAYLP